MFKLISFFVVLFFFVPQVIAAPKEASSQMPKKSALEGATFSKDNTFSVGEQVIGRRKSGEYYVGSVVKAEGGRYTVEFCDGEEEISASKLGKLGEASENEPEMEIKDMEETPRVEKAPAMKKMPKEKPMKKERKSKRRRMKKMSSEE